MYSAKAADALLVMPGETLSAWGNANGNRGSSRDYQSPPSRIPHLVSCCNLD